jgi:hypothetical protein
VQLRYETVFESFQQEDKRVFCKIVDVKGGQEEWIEADYLVGCDGGRRQDSPCSRHSVRRGFFAGHERRGSVSLTSSRSYTHGPAVQYQIITLRSTAPSQPSTAKSYGV